MLPPADAATLTAAMLEADIPDTDRQAVRGPGRLFGLQSPAGAPPAVAECSFSDAMLAKAANRALAAALGLAGAHFT